jgi:RHS repeat-associated protein
MVLPSISFAITLADTKRRKVIVHADCRDDEATILRAVGTELVQRDVSMDRATARLVSQALGVKRPTARIVHHALPRGGRLGDTNGRDDVFVRDLQVGTTTRVSTAADGSQGNGLVQLPSISADGRVVAFQSESSNLVPDDSNGVADVFVHTQPAVALTSYGYDRLYRLLGAGGPDGAPAYTYDPAGNRTSMTLGSSTSYTYDRADRISSAGSTSITVDAVGNLTARGSDTFIYDGANRLVSATVAGTTETYTYDGDGVRFSRQVGAGPLIRYVTDPSGSLPVTIADGARKYVWGLGLAYAVAGSSVEVYHSDRLGSIRAISDASGALTATYRTDEWGVPTATTGSAGQPFRFTGEPLDATGLVYLRARYYHPDLGRFMTRDTWPGVTVLPSSLHRVAYAANNPITHADPSGHILPIVAALAIGALVGGVVGGGGYLATTVATGGELDLVEGVVATGGGAIVGAACVTTVGACIAASVGASIAQYAVSPGEKGVVGLATTAAFGWVAGRVAFAPRFRSSANRPFPNPVTLPRSMQRVGWYNDFVFRGAVNLGRSIMSTLIASSPTLTAVHSAAAASAVKDDAQSANWLAR